MARCVVILPAPSVDWNIVFRKKGAWGEGGAMEGGNRHWGRGNCGCPLEGYSIGITIKIKFSVTIKGKRERRSTALRSFPS